MSKGWKRKLNKIDESINKFKNYIEVKGYNMWHMLRYFERKRMEHVNKIGRK